MKPLQKALDKTTGIKSYIAGFSLIATGLAAFLFLTFTDVEKPAMAWEIISMLVFNGLGIIGLRHSNSKLDQKITQQAATDILNFIEETTSGSSIEHITLEKTEAEGEVD